MTDFYETRSPGSYQFTWFDRFCLFFPPGWLILLNRHWQHYRPDPDGWRWSEYPLFLLPGGFYLAVVIRALRLALTAGLRAGGWLEPERTQQAAIAEPDPLYQAAFRQEILAPIARHHFQVTLQGSGHIPTDGPLMIVLNHAGMCFPWDFLCLGWVLSEQRPWFVQPLAHPLFFDHLWLRWWLPKGWTQVLGGVRAEKQSFEGAIAQKAVLLYAPEGWRGLVKGWHQRYQLAQFDSSFVRLSVRYHVPILPVICNGSESLHPFAINVGWLARLTQMPLFPLSPLIPIFVLFPSMGIWAMPASLTYYLQAPWYPWQEPSVPAQSVPRQTVLHRLAKELRSRLQNALTQLTTQR